jgi:sugar phosphate isomerase/epimerase
MAQIPIALQLYTVRDELEKDFTGALRKVAEMGYTNVELAGFGGNSAKDLKAILDEFGLKAVGSHVGLDQLEGPNSSKTIEDHNLLGIPYVVIPWLPQERREDKAGYERLAGVLNEVGRKVKAAGMTLGYHNHNFEFDQKFDGKPGLAILFDETDPNLVIGELDTYWALYAGTDPVEFLNKYPGRFPLIHIKDMDQDDRSFAPIGTGVLPLDAIVQAAPAAGAKYLIVEQDQTKGPSLHAVRTSINNLRAKGYA